MLSVDRYMSASNLMVIRMYIIDKYTLDVFGEIESYEDVFFTGNRTVAEKQFKKFVAEDPDGVYSLDNVSMRGTRKMDIRSWFEKNLQENGGNYNSCIIDATSNYPHKERLSRYRFGERPVFYVMEYIPKDTSKRRV